MMARSPNCATRHLHTCCTHAPFKPLFHRSNSGSARITNEKMTSGFLSRDLLKYTSRGQRGVNAQKRKNHQTRRRRRVSCDFLSSSLSLCPLPSFSAELHRSAKEERKEGKRRNAGSKVAVNFRTRIASCEFHARDIRAIGIPAVESANSPAAASARIPGEDHVISGRKTGD
jgi:hypothetical protein